MARRPSLDLTDSSLGRERTARLLKRLRELSHQVRMLKAKVEAAEQQTLSEHARSVNPERARTRTRYR